MKRLIRFDWAIKKLLRNKANFSVLEGFLSELIGTDLRIETILESESNKQHEADKFNRVDVLVKTTKGELMLVEVQNDPEDDYFHRMVYGISKLISEYIQEGERYGIVKKAFSINIVYFHLGQGKDYIYEAKSEFVGLHDKDVLLPSRRQKELFNIEKVSDIFPKYYILKVNNFNDFAKDTLDEWIYFLKNSEIREGFKAKGLEEAQKLLRYENLPEEEKKAYNRFVENRRIEMAVTETAIRDGLEKGIQQGIQQGLEQGIQQGIQQGLEQGIQQGLEQGIQQGLEQGIYKGKLQTAKNMKDLGVATEIIMQATQLSKEEIEKL